MSDAGSHGQAVLGFDLDPAPAFSREAFHVSSANRRAFTLLDAWPEWPAPFLNLVGPDGAGKSHLARIWAEKASAYFVDLSSIRISIIHPPAGPIRGGTTLILADDPRLAFARALAILAPPATSGVSPKAEVDADANVHAARFALAQALLGRGQPEIGADHLLDIMRRDRDWNDDGARQALLALFEALGQSAPLTVAYRKKLSSLLFS